MPKTLPNTTTTDTFQKFSGIDVFSSGFFTIANKTALVRILAGQLGQEKEYDAAFLTPGQYQLVGTPDNPIAGIEFASAVAGVPAQIFGNFYYPRDASIIAGAEFTSIVAASGGISPGLNSVQVRHNTVVVSTEPAINFVDNSGALWTILDDAGNQQASISLPNLLQVIGGTARKINFGNTNIHFTNAVNSDNPAPDIPHGLGITPIAIAALPLDQEIVVITQSGTLTATNFRLLGQSIVAAGGTSPPLINGNVNCFWIAIG